MTKSTKNNNSIIFYAPVGNLTKGFKSGGAEVGCKKTIQLLKNANYNVILIEKPSKHSNSWKSQIILFFDLIHIWLRLIIQIINLESPIIHVAGFYLNQIYFEWIIVKIGNLFGLKIVYEIRNGGMIDSYHNSGFIYKYFIKSTFINSSLLLCQGSEYVQFLHNEFNLSSIYYPNYIMDSFVTSNNNNRHSSRHLRLIYFGRVVPEKNIDFIIDICSNLSFFNISYTLDIIGSYEDFYFEVLNEKINYYRIEKNVVFHGRREFDYIYSHLKSSHFFLFPSNEKREGHSNSLTEAMGCGVVPIASNIGFNKEIIGNNELIIEDFDPIKYSNKLFEIWNSGKWYSLSDEVFCRTINNFTQSIVKQNLLDAYSTLSFENEPN